MAEATGRTEKTEQDEVGDAPAPAVWDWIRHVNPRSVVELAAVTAVCTVGFWAAQSMFGGAEDAVWRVSLVAVVLSVVSALIVWEEARARRRGNEHKS